MPDRRCFRGIVTLLLVWPVVLAACSGSGPTLEERGKELAQACHSCHSPKLFTDDGAVIDTSRAFSGHPPGEEIPGIDFTKIDAGWLRFNDHQTCWVGPWGVSFARNITSDKETGIGNWSQAEFIHVMRSGKHFDDDRTLSQPMPWTGFRSFSNRDMVALYAYLMSTKPIVNRVPDSIPLEDLR